MNLIVKFFLDTVKRFCYRLFMAKKPLLTIREQEFYALLCTYREMPRQCDLARKMGIQRQRVHQLVERLRDKGYLRRERP